MAAEKSSDKPSKSVKTSAQGNIELPPDEYADYISTRALEKVDARITKREMRWRAVTTLIFAILGVLGYTSITRFTANLDDKLTQFRSETNSTINQFSAQVNSSLARFETDIPKFVREESTRTSDLILREVRSDIARITREEQSDLWEQIEANNVLALYLAAANRIHLQPGAFRIEDADLALNFLSRLKNEEDLFARREFIVASENLADAIHLAFDATLFDRFFDLAGEPLMRDIGIWQTMIYHYMHRALGEPLITSRIRNALEELQDTAGDHDFRELALMTQLILDYRETQAPTDNGTQIVSRLADLGSEAHSVIQRWILAQKRIESSSEVNQLARTGAETAMKMVEAYGMEAWIGE